MFHFQAKIREIPRIHILYLEEQKRNKIFPSFSYSAIPLWFRKYSFPASPENSAMNEDGSGETSYLQFELPFFHF